MKNRTVTVIVTAAGSGQRFKGAMPKQFLPLSGIPVLARTLIFFNALDHVHRIAVTLPEGYADRVQKDIVEAYRLQKIIQLTVGGANRQQSVYKALRALAADTDIILVHDGVRPLVNERTVREVIAGASEGVAAVAGVKATDTIKLTDENGIVLSTPEREKVWTVQTPQGFLYETLLTAHKQADADGYIGTDDAMLVERLRLAPVRMITGSKHNIKITTPEDLRMAEILLSGETAEQYL